MSITWKKLVLSRSTAVIYICNERHCVSLVTFHHASVTFRGERFVGKECGESVVSVQDCITVGMYVHSCMLK